MSKTDLDGQDGLHVEKRRANPLFEWVGRRVRLAAVVVLVVSVLVGLAGYASRVSEENPEDPAFDPGGEIYDIQDREEELFAAAPDVVTARFFVESTAGVSGDVLTRDALLELLTNAERVRADDEAQRHLVKRFDPELGTEIDGIGSLAHVVDDHLPAGLAGADDAEVKIALSEILAEDSPRARLRTTLSQLTTSSLETIAGRRIEVWRSPVLLADVVYERESFDIADPDSTDEALVEFQHARAAELWLRDVQDMLGTDSNSTAVLGLAIDQILTDEEQGNAAAPFIMLAIVVIVLLVGVMVRSYWASAVVAACLAVTFLLYTGAIALVGLKDSVLLSFIVPIAVLSIGVDFFIHGFGRCREVQAGGLDRKQAYPVGMTAAAMAILLALSTSVAAFLSNASSSIEAIREFGVAAAIGLVTAYLVVGVLGPKLVLAVEDATGPRPVTQGPRLAAKLGFVVMALAGGVTVTLTVVAPHVGVGALLIIFVPLCVYLPYRVSRLRSRRAVEAGRSVVEPRLAAGHGLRRAGTVVHFLARWRVVTVPATVVLAAAGVYGFTQVEESFKPSDFISSDTDLIRSVEKLDTHFGASTGVTAYLYVEGDLTALDTLAAMEAVVADVDETDTAREQGGETPFLARDFDGRPVASRNAADLVRAVVGSPEAVAAVESSRNVSITVDENGLPTTAEQVAAIYDLASDDGVAGPDGLVLWTPEEVAQAVHVGDGFQATRIEVELSTISDLDLMAAAGAALEDAAIVFDAATPEMEVLGVSGDAVADETRLREFTRSMLLSLVIAFVLCALIAWVFMRSLTYALVSVVPILLVVGWVYGFMYVFGYTINPVTATIAAIAIGVGVDFAMHFTMRFREEFVGEPSRFPALRRAGEGTGGALVLSALTSIGGFMAMARSPMPVFADFGLLTAVMIFFSLVVALFVLPSLLLVVTPSRRGEERQDLLDALRTREYDPHSRETALAARD